MRKTFAFLAVAGLLLAACAEDDPTVGGTGGALTGATGVTAPTGPTAAATAADCAADNADAFESPGTLTVGTGNPAFPPWWEGGTSGDSEFELNDPSNGEGYEGAVVADLTVRLGFSFPDQVTFVPVGFNKSFAPGEKPYDFVLQQISYRPERDEAVDFSESYYDTEQAVVTTKGSPIDGATSLADLSEATLGAPIGTTSLSVIEEVIQPDPEPAVYDDLAAAIQDLNNGAIDGIVVDVSSAFFITAVQLDKGVIVGQIETEEIPDRLGMVFETGSPLVECVNLGLQEMRDDGTLEALEQEWLADATDVPVLT
ncbi:MAG: ABC transporter substrate-binding protein [Actinobacteria bacterium]|nr:ABC transporter substrate-binding protein [Actinomycetota bacterium]